MFPISLGSVCDGDCPHWSVRLHEGLPLQVPGSSLHCWSLRTDLPGSLPQLLVPRIHKGKEAAQGCAEKQGSPEWQWGSPFQWGRQGGNQRHLRWHNQQGRKLLSPWQWHSQEGKVNVAASGFS